MHGKRYLNGCVKMVSYGRKDRIRMLRSPLFIRSVIVVSLVAAFFAVLCAFVIALVSVLVTTLPNKNNFSYIDRQVNECMQSERYTFDQCVQLFSKGNR